MLLLSGIDTIFDIEEEENMNISDNSDNGLNDMLNQILDATDSVGQVSERQDNDIIQQESSETERFKTYYLSVKEYTEWIRNLERARLSYNKHDYKWHTGGSRKKTNGQK
ncbi:10549_t:CDS:1, partial [Cetraspora pellucida]